MTKLHKDMQYLPEEVHEILRLYDTEIDYEIDTKGVIDVTDESEARHVHLLMDFNDELPSTNEAVIILNVTRKHKVIMLEDGKYADWYKNPVY